VSISFIIAAAGRGERLGGVDKPLLPLAGRPVIVHSLENLSEMSAICEIVVVGRPEVLPAMQDAAAPFGQKCRVVAGGQSRIESVYRGLQALTCPPDLVGVHDGARPLAPPDLIRRVVDAAGRRGAAVPALPLADTVKRVCDDEPGIERICTTLFREQLRRVQTPQVFEHKMLLEAYCSLSPGDAAQLTDDASVVERAGGEIYTVLGDERNIKITTWEDYARVRWVAGQRGDAPGGLNLRVGVGYDSHRFCAGRKLYLGGVAIAHRLGLAGHSDADAVLHAICDALLGACGLGDIGEHFPPGAPQFRDASSAGLLCEVVQCAARAGWRPGNIDVTIIAEEPRLAPYIGDMRKRIASITGLEEEAVSVKATTAEEMGAIGRSEGIASIAVCSVFG